MTRGKKLMGLCVILAACWGASYWATNHFAETETTDEAETVTVYNTELDNIVKLDWNHEGETITFTNNDDVWQYADDPEFPVDETFINNMLSNISNVTTEKVIDTPDELSAYGLVDGECVIHVSTDSGTTEFVIGDQTTIDQQRYLSIGDGKVYMVSENILSSFEYGLLDLVAKEDVPSVDDVQTVSLKSGEQEYTVTHVEVEEETEAATEASSEVTSEIADETETVNDAESETIASDETETEIETEAAPEWFCSVNGAAKQAIDTELGENLVSEISNLKFGACADYNASEEELQELGFDEEELVVTVSNGTDSFVIAISKDNSYIHITDSAMVYENSADFTTIISSLNQEA